MTQSLNGTSTTIEVTTKEFLRLVSKKIKLLFYNQQEESSPWHDLQDNRLLYIDKINDGQNNFAYQANVSYKVHLQNPLIRLFVVSPNFKVDSYLKDHEIDHNLEKFKSLLILESNNELTDLSGTNDFINFVNSVEHFL
jgi:hypothetical protein